MADNTDNDDAPDGPGPPSVNIPTIDKRWISQDLQLLRSGLFADADITCKDDATPRKVHRHILVGRSVWFKKAFTCGLTQLTAGAKETTECKVNLQETAWRVDLMLYFFYTGGVDLEDEALTSGHDIMDISVELLRLGDFFRSPEMSLYGKSMLTGYLGNFLTRICGSVFPGDKEVYFNCETNFPQRFCGAIANAFDKDRPVKLAQDILADFAFAARFHLFKNTEFMSFIKDQVFPEFGNLVLVAQMNGSVSDVFKNHHAFQQWQDWRVTPPTSAPPKPQGGGLFGGSPAPAGGLFGTASSETTGFGTRSTCGSGGGQGTFNFGGGAPK